MRGPSSAPGRVDKATRHIIVRSARDLFARRGYADTTMQQVAEAAVIRPAVLEKHFDDQESLFRAVYEQLAREVAMSIAAATKTTADPKEQLKAGARGYLDAALRPDVQRIFLLDAPFVLPAEFRQEIADITVVPIVSDMFKDAINSGALGPWTLEPLSHMFLGACREAAMYIVRAADPRIARAEVGPIMDAFLLTGLGPPDYSRQSSANAGMPTSNAVIGQDARRFGK